MNKWPSDKIERKSTDKLIPYARNSRTHSEEQIGQIAASIKEWGFTTPILVDEDNEIIAGHGRLLAAQKLDIKEVPVMVAEDWTEAQKKAYVIADNKLALNAGWDNEMLKVEIDNLKDLDFDINLTGFNLDELSELFPDDEVIGLTDEDAVPEAPINPVTIEGDVWLLNNHRLMCGDSTNIDAVDKLMNGLKADLVFTDPPYGMSYGGGRARGDDALNKKGGVLIKAHGMIKGDDLQGDNLIGLVRDALATAKTTSKAGAAFYVCFTWRTYKEFENALNECGLSVSNCSGWDNKSIGLGNANYRAQDEIIFYCKGCVWQGDKSQSDVWYMSRGATGDYVHPTQKPVELIERALINSSKAGDSVLDLFGGSGSTLIAAEKTGRNARLMELDEKYVDVIVQRWEEFTGKQAIHAETGVKFNNG